jgi:hypothetical protein
MWQCERSPRLSYLPKFLESGRGGDHGHDGPCRDRLPVVVPVVPVVGVVPTTPTPSLAPPAAPASPALAVVATNRAVSGASGRRSERSGRAPVCVCVRGRVSDRVREGM